MEKQTEFQEEQEEYMEEEYEERRPGLVRRAFRKIFGTRQEPEEDMEIEQPTEPDFEEELKDTIKMIHKWLEQLPPEKLAQFKRSPDFERYKKLLRRLKLIKE